LITVRKANISDSNSLVALSKQLGYETNEDFLIKRFETLKNRQQEVIVAEINNLVVGYISYEPYYTLYMDPGLNITALVVDNQYQNKGIGKALILEAEKYAKKNNLAFLRANSSFGRIEAHKFYRKVGFDNEKDQKRFIKEIEN
jgi:ribosomal protein S18 acetylase RimI-like enzyme